MAKLDTLVKDIYGVLENKTTELSRERATHFGNLVAETIFRRLTSSQPEGQLRMSNIGSPCKRKLWYTVNKPEISEKLSGKTLLKFLYGDIIELLVLFLAEAAGHDVRGEQATLEIAGVKGHRDAIVDGVLVDVKSASPAGMGKFLYHQLLGDDPFGYYDQLNAYLAGSKDDPDLVDREGAAFIAVNKVDGQLAVDYYPASEKDYEKEIGNLRQILVQPSPPQRGFADVPDGKSGNMKLGMQCSYCSFKKECWPGLRGYRYSTGVRFLTQVARLPDVTEVSLDVD